MISEVIAFGVEHVAAGPVYSQTTARGCVIANTGVGIYTLTLDGGGADSAECQVDVECRFATALMACVIHTSDTVKTISFFDDGGLAADPTDFSVTVTKHAAGGF